MTGLDGLMLQFAPSLDVANPIWVSLLPDASPANSIMYSPLTSAPRD